MFWDRDLFLIVLFWIGGYFMGSAHARVQTTLKWMGWACKLRSESLLEFMAIVPTPELIQARKIWKAATGE